MVLVAKATSDILRAADKATPQLRAAILRALEEMRKAVPNLEGLLEAGRIDQVIDAVQVPIPDEVFATIRASLQATALTTIKPEAVTFGIEFNQVNPRAVRWAEQQAASLVSGITSPQRGPIRTAIVEGLEAGHHPRVIARHLEGLVGLTNPHQRAVDRLFRASLDAGTPPRVAQRLADRKAKQLLRWRAETIARTETIRAANMGQQLVWEEAIDSGLLLSGTRKVWLATGDNRTCKICAVLDGQVVDVGGGFAVNRQATSFTRDGDEFTVRDTKPLPQPTTERVPPAHSRCRCTIILQQTQI